MLSKFLKQQFMFRIATLSLLCSPLFSTPIGFIGGQDAPPSRPAYAAFVDSDGTLTELSGGNFPSTSGEIRSVAINSSGAGIIGGGLIVRALPM